MFLQILPKIKRIKVLDMEANFFLPISNHYLCSDLINLSKGKREPKLYEWLNSIRSNSTYFDVGTSYGQEVTLLSDLKTKNIKIVGFDCSLATAHFCALNKKLNNDNFDFIFAAISNTTGKLVKINTSSDIHMLNLQRGVVKYSYDVMTLKLDDFCNNHNLYPSHIKIDVDGAEFNVIKGAENTLKRSELKEIFIEIDNDNLEIIEYLKRYGFEIVWKNSHQNTQEIIFKKK